jgi:hypothetical protein
MKKLNIFKGIKDYVIKCREESVKRFLDEKKEIITSLEKRYTSDEIANYNSMLIINSAGWIGGDYTEKDIKLAILRDNRKFFLEKEYVDYYNKILDDQKILIK